MSNTFVPVTAGLVFVHERAVFISSNQKVVVEKSETSRTTPLFTVNVCVFKWV